MTLFRNVCVLAAIAPAFAFSAGLVDASPLALGVDGARLQRAIAFDGNANALIVPVHCANNHGKGCDGPPPAPQPPPGGPTTGPGLGFRNT